MTAIPFAIPLADGILTGRRVHCASGDAPAPLLVTLHGGSYSSAFFDLPGYSLLDRAAAAGWSAVALDRPGHGGSPPVERRDDLLAANAARVDEAVSRLWRDVATPNDGVFLIGHSIGAAVAILLAGRETDWPLAGLAISGIGMTFPPDGPPIRREEEAEEWLDVPSGIKTAAMFGPPGTFHPDAPRVAEAANQPAVRREIVDINLGWPGAATAACARVRVPVHYRQGEHDIVWSRDPAEFDRFVAAFPNAPAVDAAIVPDAAHCIDLHLAGPAFQEDQLAFAARCVEARRGRSTPPAA